MINRTFNIDLIPKNDRILTISVNQNDHDERWSFICLFDGERYTPTNAKLVGKNIKQECTVEDGMVIVEETQAMTAKSGRIELELRLDDDSHGTSNFYLSVEKSPCIQGE